MMLHTSPGEEGSNEAGKVVIAHGSVEFCGATPLDHTFSFVLFSLFSRPRVGLATV